MIEKTKRRIIEMKINNNLDNDKATLKEQAQNIVNSIVKFNIFNDMVKRKK